MNIHSFLYLTVVKAKLVNIKTIIEYIKSCQFIFRLYLFSNKISIL
jgi:hypothetical protein